MDILPLCVCVCTTCGPCLYSRRPEDPLDLVLQTTDCEPPCGCWESHLGPLDEQRVLLITRPSLQPPKKYFKNEFYVTWGTTGQGFATHFSTWRNRIHACFPTITSKIQQLAERCLATRATPHQMGEPWARLAGLRVAHLRTGMAPTFQVPFKKNNRQWHRCS